MKIAFAYFGMCRSLENVYTSHEKYIFDVLDRHDDIEYQVFIHSWDTHTHDQYVWWDTIEKKIDNGPWNLLKPKQIEIDNQDVFLESISFECFFYKDVAETQGYHSLGEWRPALIRNHLCALESQCRVFSMIEKSGYCADIVIVIRPDVRFNQELPIDDILHKLSSSDRAIVIPNFDHHEGYNDRFAVCNMSCAKHYCQRIFGISDYRKTHGRIVSEKYTKYICDRYYTPLFITFPFDIVR